MRESRRWVLRVRFVGAQARQWSVHHVYDRAEVHTLLTWSDDFTPILNRQGTIESYAIYGPYRNIVKGVIANDGEELMEVEGVGEVRVSEY